MLLPTVARRYELTLRKMGICFDFVDLLRMSFAVCGDEKDKLVAVHLANRPVHDVIAQTGSCSEILFRSLAALEKVPDRAIRRAKPVVGHKRIRRLRLVRTIENHRFYISVDFLHIAPRLSRR